MDDNRIDFGEINVPTSWDDITLKKFQEIERYYKDRDEEKEFNIIDVLDILIDKDRDYITQLPAEFLEKILSYMTFLNEDMEVDEPSNKITIKGEEYTINVMEKLKLGEYVAVDNVLKADKHDVASILAILCRKKGEVYDSKFEAEVFDERKKMFEDMPVMKVMPLISFFLRLFAMSGQLSLLYSRVEEEINLTAQRIKNSRRIGVFKKLYMKYRLMTLQKSMKSIKNTSQTSSHTLPTAFRKAKRKRLRISTKKR